MLHSTYGAYIFPEEIEGTSKGMSKVLSSICIYDKTEIFFIDVSVGLILPQDLEADIVHHFEDIMKELTVMATEEVPVELTPEEKLRLSSRIAEVLISGRLNTTSRFGVIS